MGAWNTCSCGLVCSDLTELQNHLKEFQSHHVGGTVPTTEAELHRKVKDLEARVKSLEDKLVDQEKELSDLYRRFGRLGRRTGDLLTLR